MPETAVQPKTDAQSPASISPLSQPSAEVHLLSELSRETHPHSYFADFLSNLKDFLSERPVKIHGATESKFLLERGFGAGWKENLREFFRPLPEEAKRAGDGTMLVEWQPWYRQFWQNVRDVFAPPKLPPLQVTSKPVPVKEIWSKNPQSKGIQAASVAVHSLIAVLILVPLAREVVQTTQAKNTVTVLTPIDISPYTPKLPRGEKKAGGGGGGGEHNPIPASRGRLPKFSWTQFTPPAVVPPVNPKLAMTPTVLGPPDLHLPSPNAPNWGDPLAKTFTTSSGPGAGSGIGSGCCGGVGSGQGGGVGPGQGWGTGGGPPMQGTNGYGEVVCIYCPTPTFTDEAVKVKYQGSVMLQAVITPDGRATNLHVIKGLGLGLDERAIQAVRDSWRFKPATGPNGRPAAVTVNIEVDFRLL